MFLRRLSWKWINSVQIGLPINFSATSAYYGLIVTVSFSEYSEFIEKKNEKIGFCMFFEKFEKKQFDSVKTELNRFGPNHFELEPV